MVNRWNGFVCRKIQRDEKHVVHRRRAPRPSYTSIGLSTLSPLPLVVLYRVVLLCCLVYRESSTPARRCFPSLHPNKLRINRLLFCSPVSSLFPSTQLRRERKEEKIEPEMRKKESDGEEKKGIHFPEAAI